MSLFVLSSRDGWVNIMYSGLDAVGVDQEVRNASYIRCTFKILEFLAPNKLFRVEVALFHSFYSVGWFFCVKHVCRSGSGKFS